MTLYRRKKPGGASEGRGERQRLGLVGCEHPDAPLGVRQQVGWCIRAGRGRRAGGLGPRVISGTLSPGRAVAADSILRLS